MKITDFSSYTSGIYIAGVSSTVTVKVTAEEGSASQDTPSNTETPSDTDTPSGGGNSGTENGDEEDNSNSAVTGELIKTIQKVNFDGDTTKVVILNKNDLSGLSKITIILSNIADVVTQSEDDKWWYCVANGNDWKANIDSWEGSTVSITLDNLSDFTENISVYGIKSTATVTVYKQ